MDLGDENQGGINEPVKLVLARRYFKDRGAGRAPCSDPRIAFSTRPHVAWLPLGARAGGSYFSTPAVVLYVMSPSTMSPSATSPAASLSARGIWSRLLDRGRLRLPAQTFRTWLEPTEPLTVDGD